MDRFSFYIGFWKASRLARYLFGRKLEK